MTPSISRLANNPFHSDDESPAASPLPPKSSSSPHHKPLNPFDDEADHPSFIPSRTSRTGLAHDRHREDLSHHPGAQKSSATRKPANVASFETRNPFDDDGFTPSKKPSVRKASSSILSEDHDSSRSDSASSNRQKKKQADLYGSRMNPFDDGNDDENEPVIDEERNPGKTGKSNLRNRATSLGDSAVKVAQKLKESGANQAHKLKEGGINQAQRVKETTYKTFKAKDGNIGPRSTKPRHNDLSQHETRDLLLTNGEDSRSSLSSHAVTPARYGDTFLQTGDLESKSVQELETYAVQKSEETTSRIHNCLKVAEDIRGDATKTLVTLHHQGEQIRRTHEVAVEIDHDLSAGEKLLGSLGGIFSRTWKPKKSRTITGPVEIQNDPSIRRAQHLEQRVALGLDASNSKNRTLKYPTSSGQSQQLTTQSKLEVEKAKQDDALTDLSNVLGQLKEMSMDMGSEISRQNGSLDHLQDDVIELGERVKGANVRGRRLLGK